MLKIEPKNFNCESIFKQFCINLEGEKKNCVARENQRGVCFKTYV